MKTRRTLLYLSMLVSLLMLTSCGIFVPRHRPGPPPPHHHEIHRPHKPGPPPHKHKKPKRHKDRPGTPPPPPPVRHR